MSSSKIHQDAVPGNAAMDPEMPKGSSDAPLTGLEASKEVPFADQVKGHAKYIQGKIFGNDEKVLQGAAILRGHEPAPGSNATPSTGAEAAKPRTGPVGPGAYSSGTADDGQGSAAAAGDYSTSSGNALHPHAGHDHSSHPVSTHHGGIASDVGSGGGSTQPGTHSGTQPVVLDHQGVGGGATGHQHQSAGTTQSASGYDTGATQTAEPANPLGYSSSTSRGTGGAMGP